MRSRINRSQTWLFPADIPPGISAALVFNGNIVKHAGRQALAALAPMLRKVREHVSLIERAPGTFYRKSRAFLHFHEDPSGIYADVKLDGAIFTKLRAKTPQEQGHLLMLIDEALRK